MSVTTKKYDLSKIMKRAYDMRMNHYMYYKIRYLATTRADFLRVAWKLEKEEMAAQAEAEACFQRLKDFVERSRRERAEELAKKG